MSKKAKSENKEEIVEVDYGFAMLLTHCIEYKEQLQRSMFITIEVVDYGSNDRYQPKTGQVKITGEVEGLALARKQLADIKINNGFRTIITHISKDAVDIMFDEFGSDVATIEKTYSCNIFAAPKDQAESEICIYGSKKELYDIYDKVNSVVKEANNFDNVLSVKPKILPDKEASEPVQQYLNTGKSILHSEEVERIKYLIHATYYPKTESVNESDKLSPFNMTLKKHNELYLNSCTFNYSSTDGYPPIFICASSGTGKTQLPFVLDIPLLYFLHASMLSDRFKRNFDIDLAEGSCQLIYTDFFYLSKYFRYSADNDYEYYSKQGKYTNLDDFISDTYSSYKSSLIGFIVSLCEKIVAIREQHDEHWILSQLRVSGKCNEKMTIEEGLKRMDKMFKTVDDASDTRPQKPVVFIDESGMYPSDDNFIEKHEFVRVLLRTIVIPIFMGTNASAINFIGRPKVVVGSRCDDRVFPWGYIVYQLAPFSTEKLRESKDKLLKDNNLYDNDHKRQFVDFIYTLLERERPLFCEYVIVSLERERLSQLHNRLSHNSHNTSLELLKLLGWCMYTICNKFTRAKGTFHDKIDPSLYRYNYEQLSYMLSGILHGYPDIPDTPSPSEISLYSMAIHKHLGYLSVSDFIRNNFPVYFGVTPNSSGKGLELIGRNSNTGTDYKIFHTFASFQTETLAALAFFNALLDGIFFEKSERREFGRISVACTMYKFYTEEQKLNQDTWKSIRSFISKSLNGNILETIVSMASILASHFSGFQGSQFKTWLGYFIRELDFNAVFGETAPEIKFPENPLFSTVIPYCAPILNVPWEESVASYLRSLGACVGTAHGYLGESGRDLCIMDDAEVLSGQVKFWKNNVCNKELIEIVNELNVFESKINLIIVSKFSDNIAPEIIYPIYHLRKISQYEYKLKLLNQAGDNSKCFILINLSTIISKGNIKLGDVKKTFTSSC